MPSVKLNVTLRDLSKMIDISLLHPTMTDAETLEGLQAARTYNAAAACVKPYAVTMALEALEGTDVKVCPVIGFPAGNSTISVKVFEATEVVKDGAQEVDMVINVGKALSGEWEYISEEIKQINTAVTGGGAFLKVIFETDYLKDNHIIKLCEICSEFGVAFVKTSTGYGFSKQSNGMYNYVGATNHNLKLMRKHSAERVNIKAAGGVRTLDDLLRVRALGVTRVGATATKEILQEAVKRGIGRTPIEVEVQIPDSPPRASPCLTSLRAVVSPTNILHLVHSSRLVRLPTVRPRSAGPKRKRNPRVWQTRQRAHLALARVTRRPLLKNGLQIMRRS